ncbi:17863_t:CDS:2, partial [Acaulospora morrowiae]
EPESAHILPIYHLKIGIFPHRQQEKDFTGSFQKEAFTLRKSLDYLIKDGIPEAKYYATLLDKKFKASITRCREEKSTRRLFDDLRVRHRTFMEGHRKSDMDSKLFWDRIEFDAKVEAKKREMRLAEAGTVTGIMRRIDNAMNDTQTDRYVIPTKRKIMESSILAYTQDRPCTPCNQEINDQEKPPKDDGKFDEDKFLKELITVEKVINPIVEKLLKYGE